MSTAKNLVIVESPGKIKTITQYLGHDFTVMASMGHVRDLPKNELAIDTEHKFEPKYIVSPDKKKVISGLKAKIGKATKVFIATDSDREGEAIGWHLVEALHLSKHDNLERIVFHEITKDAILEALKTPRKIDKNLVDAQQARRILDRLVGYELSPLLWSKIKYGLSAGRVQSVATRLVVDREREIQTFKPEEYWSLIGDFLSAGNEPFQAFLHTYKNKKIVLGNSSQTNEILEILKKEKFQVGDVEKKEVRRSPAPPFTTSTLQQEAARKLGFSVKKTMSVAQGLYEGVSLETGQEGLITYMRTDSVNLSATALQEAKTVITHLFGSEFALESPRYYKVKKGAQEAHEAIRPTRLSRTPESVQKYLDKDASRLYELIWKRTLACQMEVAIFDQVGADILSGDYSFRATGQTLKFAGFLKVYKEDIDEDDLIEDDENRALPPLTKGESARLNKFLPEQHFTKAPPRYTEASLVKKMEAEGIGRPSTYAPTISTIITRNYIVKEQKQLMPTDTGFIVNDFLVEHFPKILDFKFTSRMEDMLDEIEEGHETWQDEIKEFYIPFHKAVLEKTKSIKKEDVVNQKTDEICEKCRAPVVLKFGRFGKFFSCSRFPECDFAKPADPEDQKRDEIKKLELAVLQKSAGDKKCPTCEKKMIAKSGRFGDYFACEDYPTCRTSESILKTIDIKCLLCGKGELAEKHTRKGGKPFYGCNKFPICRLAVWDKPNSAEEALSAYREHEEKINSGDKGESGGKRTGGSGKKRWSGSKKGGGVKKVSAGKRAGTGKNHKSA